MDLLLLALIVQAAYRHRPRCQLYLQPYDRHRLCSELTLNLFQKMSEFVLLNHRVRMCADFRHEHRDKQSVHSNK